MSALEASATTFTTSSTTAENSAIGSFSKDIEIVANVAALPLNQLGLAAIIELMHKSEKLSKDSKDYNNFESLVYPKVIAYFDKLWTEWDSFKTKVDSIAFENYFQETRLAAVLFGNRRSDGKWKWPNTSIFNGKSIVEKHTHLMESFSDQKTSFASVMQVLYQRLQDASSALGMTPKNNHTLDFHCKEQDGQWKPFHSEFVKECGDLITKLFAIAKKEGKEALDEFMANKPNKQKTQRQDSRAPPAHVPTYHQPSQNAPVQQGFQGMMPVQQGFQGMVPMQFPNDPQVMALALQLAQRMIQPSASRTPSASRAPSAQRTSSVPGSWAARTAAAPPPEPLTEETEETIEEPTLVDPPAVTAN